MDEIITRSVTINLILLRVEVLPIFFLVKCVGSGVGKGALGSIV